MINYINYTDKGEITTVGISTRETLEASGVPFLEVKEFDPELSLKYYIDFEKGRLIEMPLKKEHHDFDWDKKEWVPNLDRARQLKYARIDKVKSIQVVQPIDCAGIIVDADSESQRKISGKINEIAFRETLGSPIPNEMCVWRASNNDFHTFADQAHLKDWLSMAVITIAARETNLHMWKWAKGTAINSASMEELDGIPEDDFPTV